MTVAAFRAGALTGLLNQSSAQITDGSLTFDDDKSSHLKRTFATGNRRTWTWSGWVKRTEFGSTQGRIFGGGITNTDYFELYFPSGDELRVIWYSGGQTLTTSTAKFRDTGWYHIVLAVDTTLSTGADRIKMYVNAELLARDSTTPSEDYETTVNKNVEHNIGKYLTGSANSHFDGKITNTYFIDGLALGPGYFGFTDPLTGTWRPKRFRAEGTTLNDGTTWSSNVTGANNPANAFDGSLSSNMDNNGSAGTPIVLTATFRNVTSFRYYTSNGSPHDVTFNGATTIRDAAASGWRTIDNPPSTITSISWIHSSQPSAYVIVEAIEINGEILRNNTTTNLDFGTNGFYLPLDGDVPIGKDMSGLGNDFTPVNFGGSNSIDKATGALPILNTVNGGNVATAGVRTDAHASNLVLALPLVGGKEDVVASINSAQTNVTVTNNGSVPFQTTQSNFYGGSAFFEDSSSDNLTFTNFGSRFEFTGDYTIEAWIYPTDSGAADGSIFVESDDSSYFAFNFDPGTQFNIYNNSGSPSWSPSTNLPPANKWSHIALVRSGSTQTIYVNGNSIATNTASGTHGYASPTFARIGGGASGALDSYVQDLRVYKGVAKYTSNFIPASTNPDILPDTPSGVSGKSELTKIVDGAVSFDGTDYLTVPDGSNDFSFGTGAYTVEGYLYPTTLTGNGDANPRFFCCGTPLASSNRNQLQIVITAAGRIRLDTNSANYQSADGDVVVNKWQHIAVARDGSGNLKAFVDGRQVISQSSVNNDITNNDGISLGIEAGFSSRFTGFMSNVRILKGTALYTSAFTPPERTLSNVTNTKLLCCQSNVEPGGASVAPKISGINDGTQWSIGGFDDPNWDTSHPIERGFNGLADYGTGNVNMARPKNENVTATWNAPGGGIPFTTLKLRAARDATSTKAKIRVNGVDVTSQYTSNTSVLATKTISGLSGISSPLTKIELTCESGQAQPRFSAIYIDDVMLVDPVVIEGESEATTFNPFNTDINTVRGQETGYATWSPLVAQASGDVTLSDGNLRTTNGSTRTTTMSDFPLTGKTYWEIVFNSGTYNYYGMTRQDGFNTVANNNSGIKYTGYKDYSYGHQQTDGKFYNASNIIASPGAYANGDVMGWAFDADNHVVKLYKNGALILTYNDIDAGQYYPSITHSGSATADTNFGQKPYKFSPPDGYQPLSFSNILSDTGIIDPTQYMEAIDYTGTASARSITGLNFGTNPDLVWIKGRSFTSNGRLIDTVRGTTKELYSAETTEETTQAQSVTAFNTNGFSIGSMDNVNKDDATFVAWCWRAGGNKNTFNVDGEGFGSASDVGMSAGAQNSNHYNQSETWSTASASDAKGFDGSMAYDSGATRLYGTGTYHMVLNAATSFRNVTAVRIGTSENVGTVRINGTLYSTTYISAVGLTVTNPPSVVTTIEILGASSGVQLSYIMINGVLLVDNGVSVTNVPSIPADKCSVGTKNGFSIVQYEGNGTTNQTLAHGLSQAPDFVVIKNMSAAYDWAVWHKDVGFSGDSVHNSPEYYMLEFTDAGRANWSQDNIWDVHSHSLRIHNSSSGNWVNTDGSDYIMYSWHSVPGVQKFGIYSGNGESAAHKGPFVELGFRPALVVIKRQNGTGNWIVYDNKRDTVNPLDGRLYWNTTSQNVDNSGYHIDFLSNGFKIRGGNNDNYNASSDYIYCAWAEAPSTGLYGSQSTAR